MANGKTTKSAVEKEMRLAERRLATIEKHSGAHLSINKDAILQNPNRAEVIRQLKNVRWSALKEGKGFSKDFINMKVDGRYWTAKAGWVETQTEVQGKDAVQLLKAVAHRESITGTVEKISISGEENIGKAIDYFKYFKTSEQYERYLAKQDKIVAYNFRQNLKDLINSGKLSPEEVKKMKKLVSMIKKDPRKWAKIIKDHKLYDIAGINLFDSDDLSEDIAENYDLIMETVEKELASNKEWQNYLKKLDADAKKKAKHEAMKSARKRATKEARKNVSKKYHSKINK